MPKNKSESKKGKPRSAGSRQAKIKYYYSISWPRNMARRAFRVYKRHRNLQRRKAVDSTPEVKEAIYERAETQAHSLALQVCATKGTLSELVKTFYLKRHLADNS